MFCFRSDISTLETYKVWLQGITTRYDYMVWLHGMTKRDDCKAWLQGMEGTLTWRWRRSEEASLPRVFITLSILAGVKVGINCTHSHNLTCRRECWYQLHIYSICHLLMWRLVSTAHLVKVSLADVNVGINCIHNDNLCMSSRLCLAWLYWCTVKEPRLLVRGAHWSKKPISLAGENVSINCTHIDKYTCWCECQYQPQM